MKHCQFPVTPETWDASQLEGEPHYDGWWSAGETRFHCIFHNPFEQTP